MITMQHINGQNLLIKYVLEHPVYRRRTPIVWMTIHMKQLMAWASRISTSALSCHPDRGRRFMLSGINNRWWHALPIRLRQRLPYYPIWDNLIIGSMLWSSLFNHSLHIRVTFCSYVVHYNYLIKIRGSLPTTVPLIILH